MLRRLAQGKNRRLGAWAWSWKITRCRNSRADRKSKATDGGRRRRAQHFGGQNFSAQTLQSRAFTHPASGRDEAAFCRKKRNARENGDAILQSFFENAFVKRQPNDCGGTRSPVEL